MKISACYIVKNESDNIGRSIESIKDIVDEIIVVDTGSTDGTIDIASKYNANIFEFEWVNDFAAARNYAVDKAKYGWIIFLDADEYFVEGSQNKIVQLIRRCSKNYDAIITTAHDLKDNEVIATYPIVRIFRNGNIRYENPIHETLKHKNRDIKFYKNNDPNIFSYHTGYDGSKGNEKDWRNIEILETSIKEGKQVVMNHYYLSDSYLNIGNYEKTEFHSRKALEMGFDIPGANVKLNINLISAMINLEKEPSLIYNELNRVIKRYHFHPMLYYIKGKLEYDNANYSGAVDSFEKALLKQKDYNSIEYNNFYKFINITNDYLIELYKKMDNLDKMNDYLLRIFYKTKNLKYLMILLINFNHNDIEEKLCGKYSMKQLDDFYMKIHYFKKINTSNFDEIYNEYLEGLSFEQQLAIVSFVIKNDNVDLFEKIKYIVKPSYLRILNMFFDFESVIFENDFKDYFKIYQCLIYFGLSDRYVEISNEFCQENIEKIHKLNKIVLFN